MSDESLCRVCSEPMGDESGHTHDECREDAADEFGWYDNGGEE